MLQFVLLFLLHHHLVLIELLYCLAVNFLEKIRGLCSRSNLTVVALCLTTYLVWLFLDPKILRRLEVISEYRNYLLNLVIGVLVNEKVWIRLNCRHLFRSAVQI